MNLNLTKKPKNVRIIEGFPGFGLVAVIASEYLVNHLNCELIGRYYFEELPASVAIHQEHILQPVGIFYNKSNNLIIISSVSGATGVEWKAADVVLEIAKQLSAKEIISLEGVGSQEANSGRVFYYSDNKMNKSKLDKIGLTPMKEGIIMGPTAAILLKDNFPTTCLFAETESNIPDSKAAAKIIEILDKYVGLKVDYKGLLKQAQEFEAKVSGIMDKTKQAQKEIDMKKMSYVG